MEVRFFEPTKYAQLYNCNLYQVDRIPFNQRQHFWIGLSFIVLFLFFEIIYFPSILILRKPQFYQQSCYKIMYYMGISDVICLTVSGLFTGWFAISGYVYCSSPDLIYFLGIAALTLWVLQTDFGMILALNRCLEMYNPQINSAIFGNKKTYFWIALALLHASFYAIFTKPVTFSGLYVSWFFNPHVGYINDDNLVYLNIFHFIHNCTVVVVMTSCYVIFIVLLFRKANGHYNNNTNIAILHKDSYIQVFIICFITEAAAVLYVYMQFFAVADIVIYLASYGWFFVHGSPAVIYLLINKSIRKKFFHFVRYGNTSSIAVVQTTVTGPLTNLRVESW